MKIFLLFFLLISSLYSLDEDELDSYKNNISDFYYRFLDSSTSFLYDKNQKNYEYIKKHNKLRLYFNNTIDKDGNIKSSVYIRANLKLPKISKNLYISVDKESDNSIDAMQNKSAVNKEKQNSRVGLKYYFLREDKQAVFAKLGGRIKLDGSKFYLQLGANKERKFNNITTYVYMHEYYYIKDQYFNTEFGVNFRKELNTKYTLMQNNGVSIDRYSNTYISNSLILDQYLNSIEMLSYWTTLSTIYDDNHFHADSVSFNIKYHRMLKKWIFIDVIPSVIKNLSDDKTIYRYLHINFGFIF